MSGLPSPGYQCPTSVYQPTPQQVYSLTQTGQQVTEFKLIKNLINRETKNDKVPHHFLLLYLLVFNWWAL